MGAVALLLPHLRGMLMCRMLCPSSLELYCPCEHTLAHVAPRCCRGQGPEVKRVHDLFAAHLWGTYGMPQLSRAAAHWARGSDAAGYAKGVCAQGFCVCMVRGHVGRGS